MPQQEEEPKRQLLSIFYNRHCVFPLSRAAVVHSTHVIEGGSVETRGALNASPAALQRVNCGVSGACAASALASGCELDLPMATWGQEQCCFMATMNPLKIYGFKNIGVFFFFSSFILFPLSKGYPQHK